MEPPRRWVSKKSKPLGKNDYQNQKMETFIPFAGGLGQGRGKKKTERNLYTRRPRTKKFARARKKHFKEKSGPKKTNME